jgi:hypothetical protein
VALVSAGLVSINALQVGNFGELEYWFALITVIAIVVFIAVGFLLITGLGPWPAAGLANLTQHGGFLTHGWRGVWLALTLAITSYMGVEVIAVTAGEAQDPPTSIPRAMRTIVYRLIIFYVLAMTVMLAMTPWNQTGSSTVSGSPFVRAFQTVGIPFAAGIMNLVVITAALSSANTNLYTSTRMLFSLSRGEYAPRWLSQRQRSAASCSCCLERWDARRHLAGNLFPEQHLLVSLWDRSCGHVLCMDHNPAHAPAISGSAQLRCACDTSPEIACPPLADAVGDGWVARCRAEHILGERPPVHGSDIPSFID